MIYDEMIIDFNPWVETWRIISEKKSMQMISVLSRSMENMLEKVNANEIETRPEMTLRLA